MNDNSGAAGAILALFSGGFLLFMLAVGIVTIAGMWKVFTKAGQPGWAAIVPFFNLIVVLQIIGRPVWWILLCLIPLVNFVIALIIMIDLAKSFGQGAGFGLGLFFLGCIFMPVLGFGSSRYIGPAGNLPVRAMGAAS